MDALAISLYGSDLFRVVEQWSEIKRPNGPITRMQLVDRVCQAYIAACDTLSLFPLPKESAHVFGLFSGVFRSVAVCRSVYLLRTNAPGINRAELRFNIALHLINIGEITSRVFFSANTTVRACFLFADSAVRASKVLSKYTTFATVDIVLRTTIHTICNIAIITFLVKEAYKIACSQGAMVHIGAVTGIALAGFAIKTAVERIFASYAVPSSGRASFVKWSFAVIGALSLGCTLIVHKQIATMLVVEALAKTFLAAFCAFFVIAGTAELALVAVNGRTSLGWADVAQRMLFLSCFFR